MTNHIDLINGTITLDLGAWIGFIAMSMMFLFGFMAFFFLAVRFGKLLDRYRLKYTFDREIERKEPTNVTEDRLNKREKYFKKRVFKD